MEREDLKVTVTIPVTYDVTDYINKCIDEHIVEFEAYKMGINTKQELLEEIREEAVSHIRSMGVPWDIELEHTCGIMEGEAQTVIEPLEKKPRLVGIGTYRFAIILSAILGAFIGWGIAS